MKSLMYALLPFAASAMFLDEVPKALQAFPFGKNMLKLLPMASGSIIERSRVPRLRNDTIKKAIRYGPFTLPSRNEKVYPSFLPKFIPQSVFPIEKGELQAMARVNPLCTDCFVIRGTTYMEYENGTLATLETGVYNHHAVLFDLEKRAIALDCAKQSFARASSGPSIFAASAADGGNLEDLVSMGAEPNPFPRGSYTHPKSEMMMLTQLMNYRPEAQKIYVVAEAEYLPGQPKDFMESAGIIVSVTGCNKAIDFLVPTPQYSKTSPEIIVPKDALLVSMGGHMHDGGESMDLMINGKIACISHAKYSAPKNEVKMDGGMDASSIIGMSRCLDRVQVKKGDKLSLTAHYDLVKHPMRTSNSGEKETVMGLGIFEFVLPVDSAYP